MSDNPSVSAHSGRGLVGTLIAFIRVMRPAQWTKNGVVFAAAVFSGSLWKWPEFRVTLAATALFCIASSGGYILNDYFDREADAQHPQKKHRPLASGQLNPQMCLIAALAMQLVAVTLALALDRGFGIILMIYVLMGQAYSLRLKHVEIVDVLIIAAGFLLRAIGGALVIDVVASAWLLLCTGFLALFLGFGKRRAELLRVGKEARSVLTAYDVVVLDQIVVICAASVILCYSLYTYFSPHTRWMMTTIPFVLFGTFRYLLLVHAHAHGEAPDKTLLQDRPLQFAIAGWLLTVLTVLYLKPQFQLV
jgi:4-hydroxybenzoate polyprenyltransferase